MKIERTQNTKRNLLWGTLRKIVGLIIPFICRKAIIDIFGINYLGLNSLFSSILSTLNLAELGFGSAIVYFLYGAIADDDKTKIRSLLQLYKKTYRVIGFCILLAGIAIMPFLPNLIKKDIPVEINLYIVYLLTLLGTVVTYFLYAYKNCLLIAYQRDDIISKIATITTLIERFFQLICIIAFKNYYLYLVATILMNAINNVVTAKYVDMKYPGYKAEGEIKEEEKHQIKEKIKGLISYKIGNVVLNSADSVVISAFLGLIISGKYGNYYFVLTTLFSFLAIYYSSFQAGLGNSIAIESVEKNLNLFKKLQIIQNWIIDWATICLLCLLQDFITIYAGTDNLLEFGIVISLSIYFFVWKIQDVVYVFKEARGMWDKDRYRPLIGSVINLVLNILLVNYIGLYGVIFSTVAIFLFIDLPWSAKVLFKNYFNVSRMLYYRLLLHAVIMLLIMGIPTFFMCNAIPQMNHFARLIIKILICVLIPNIIFYIANRKNTVFSQIMDHFRAMIKKP